MGRPRSFCVDTALNQALEVFWRKGYEGASIKELTEAMGINKPSMYAAFGNKEDLFRKALERYTTEKGLYLQEAIDAPTAYGLAHKMLHGAAVMMTDPSTPFGCLTVKGAMTCNDQDISVKREIDAIRINTEIALEKRLEQARQKGDLPADSDPVHLRRYLSTVIQGMSVQASSGASREELHKVADIALKAWPTQS
jgi:AcrR family transcriptional regulator